MIHFDVETLKVKVQENEKIINNPSFWDDQKEAIKIVNDNNLLKNNLNKYLSLEENIKELNQIYIMLKEEYDEEIHESLSSYLVVVEKDLDDFSVEVLLSDEFDSCNAIIEIHPGAGGTESQDWAQMLFEMYVRYSETHNFKTTTYDYQAALDAGLKSVTFLVKGKYAYGYLKGERDRKSVV